MTTTDRPSDRPVTEQERMFPIMGGPAIPWAMIAPHERQAIANHDQTLERLAERGGLSCGEAVCVLNDWHWRERAHGSDAEHRAELIKLRDADLTVKLCAATERAERAEAKLAAQVEETRAMVRFRREAEVARDGYAEDERRARKLLVDAAAVIEQRSINATPDWYPDDWDPAGAERAVLGHIRAYLSPEHPDGDEEPPSEILDALWEHLRRTGQLVETKIPGLCAQHAIITPTCRANRGDAGALDEAVVRIRREYEACLAGRGSRDAADYHVVLVVEPNDPPEPPDADEEPQP